MPINFHGSPMTIPLAGKAAFTSGASPRRPTPPLALRVAAFVALVCVALVALDAWQLWRAREVQLRDTEIASANLAKALGQHAYDTFKEADTVLVGLVERVENDGTEERALVRLHALLVRRVAELPQLHGLFIYDTNGAWVANSQAGAPASLNNAEREYFIYHRTHDGRAPHIGPPIRSKSTGEWVVTVSRRVDQADGSFGGVVLATIRMEYFRRFYDSFDIGEKGAVFVATDTGTLLLRRPFNETTLGKDISALPLFNTYLPRAPVATNTFTSRLDGVTRVNSHRRLNDYPLVVSAALSRDEALAGWRDDVLFHGVVLTLLVGGLALLGWRLTRQIARRAAAETELRRARGELETLNAALEQLAMQDGLTGLANRRKFDLALAAEFARARREGLALALIMIDVDHFKRYNDIYGHAAGDACLRQAGAAITAAVRRPSDLSARYGGEEMAVLLPGTDLAGALVVAESIRAQIAALAIAHAGNSAGIVTVSAGVQAFTPVDAAATPLALVEQADGALYRAKALGRNQVCGPATVAVSAAV
jgi:diguanylate cyclase (GGDEF)-like protein